MRALVADRLAPTLPSVLGLLIHRRPGLADVRTMPRIERQVQQARVDSDWLRSYRACTGLPLRPEDALPPLALQIAAAPLHLAIMADRAFPFRPLGIVHQSQHIQQWDEIDAAASIDLRAVTTEAREERRGISFGLVTEARVSQVVVWRSEVRVLSISRKASPGGHNGPDAAEFKAQQATTSAFVDVPESMGRTYARLSGDPNPVHVHAVLARLFGFPRAIAHGTWTLARALVASRLPVVPPYMLEARFRRPVELPSRMLVTAYAGSDKGEFRLRVADSHSESSRLVARLSLAGASNLVARPQFGPDR
jgi:acyl dehydratase